MSDYLEGLDPADLRNVVKKLVVDVAYLMGKTLDVNELDEITTAMGVMLSGEFRSGNGLEPGEGFTGGRFGYPGFEYNGAYWFFVGVNNDVLMVGVDLATGKLLAANGAVVIGDTGIDINGILYALYQHATDPDGNNPRLGKFGMEYPDGKTIAALALSFIDSTTSAELMGSNRSFELGDFTQWTAGANWSVEADGGIYLAAYTGAGTSTLVSDRVAVTAGSNYELSAVYTAVGMMTTEGPLLIKVKFYDAASAGNLIGTSTVFSGSFAAPVARTTVELIARAPVGALSCEFEVTASGFSSGSVGVDEFSITAVPLVRKIRFDPDPTIVDDTTTRKILAGTKELQVPRAPVAALVATASGNVTNGAHTYKVTCLDAEGETIPSLVSNSVTVDASHKQVTVTLPLGGTGTTSRKIYRTAAGGTAYLLLATLADNTTTSYTDNIADASLGAAAPGVNLTGSSPLFPVKALVRWKVDAKSNRKAAGVAGAWEDTSSGAVAPWGFYGYSTATGANGDWCEFDVFLAPGTYTMLVHYARSSNGGKMDFYENNNPTPFATAVDYYLSGSEKIVTGCVLTGSGVNHIRTRINGKHASSGGYNAYIADIEFVRE